MEDLADGELVILQNAHHFSHWNGALGVVIGLRSRRRALDLNTNEHVMLDAYRVRILDRGGIPVVCERHQLRKLADPGADLSEDHREDLEIPEPTLTE